MTWEPGHRYKIIYTDDSGDTTVRVIDVLAHYLSRHGLFYLRAFCHLREEERTFRVDRVEDAQEIAGDSFWSPSSEIPMAAPPSMADSPRVWVDRPDPPVKPVSPPKQARPRAPSMADSPYAWVDWPDSPVKTVTVSKPAPPPPPPISDSPYAWANRSDPSEKRGTGSRAEGVKNTSSSSSSSFGRAAISLLFIAGFRVLIDPPDYPSNNYKYIPPPPIVRPAPVVPTPAPRPAPTPQTKTVLDMSMIGGHRLFTTSTHGLKRYEVPDLGIVATTRKAAVAGIRGPQFARRTEISDPTLLWLYLEADLDGSGRLSFDELEAFQRKTYKQFRYINNDTALRPDQFVAQGGGDCEDFALYTAGLLRFWGWEPYIASFSPGGGSDPGHALCFSYEAGSLPGAYRYYRLDNYTASDGTVLKNGKYIPIDYDHVGGLSDAVGPGWKLRTVYIPEKIYGLPM